ncbi:acetylcholine receptor subunit delta-like [Haliotis rubra]|uniref:acetylcholine receptor subunit delta-like n=1 Tax=Haliotis rubra TaxID=36100 RepID=UPI001EE6200D|nr:acetylcholine receptor subunit delta-like [Haliotis rubra]
MSARCVVLCCVTLCCVVWGHSEKRAALVSLHDALFGRTNKTIPPFVDNSSTVDVQVTFEPVAIIDLDSASQVLTVLAYFELRWKDMDLAWNISQYYDNDRIEVEPDNVWTPSIILSNSIDSHEPVASRNVFVSWQGFMSWQLPGTFRTSCKIDVFRYPFDKQTCLVLIMPTFGYKINFTIDAVNLQNVKDLTVQNGEWNYLHTNSQLVPVESGGVNAAQFIITLERRPTYYLINIIFPMVLMSLLNPCVFLIPARSGEKLGFLMAVFVSHAVFLNLIQQTMPPTSDSVSLLALFLALLEVQGFLTILASIVVLGVHHRKEKAEETAAKHQTKGVELVEVKHGRRFRGCAINIVKLFDEYL